MGKYIDNNLVNGEKVLFEATVSKWSQLPMYILGVLFLAFYGIGIIFFIVAYIRIVSTELALTDKRVIAKFGFISRESVELLLNKVESVKVDQSILGRIFNYGNIRIIGTGGTNTPIPFIYNPLEFRKKVSEMTQHN